MTGGLFAAFPSASIVLIVVASTGTAQEAGHGRPESYRLSTLESRCCTVRIERADSSAQGLFVTRQAHRLYLASCTGTLCPREGVAGPGIDWTGAAILLRSGTKAGEYGVKGGLIGGAIGVVVAAVSSSHIGASGQDSGALLAAGFAAGGISGLVVGAVIGGLQVRWVPIAVDVGPGPWPPGAQVAVVKPPW